MTRRRGANPKEPNKDDIQVRRNQMAENQRLALIEEDVENAEEILPRIVTENVVIAENKTMLFGSFTVIEADVFVTIPASSRLIEV